MRAILAIRQMSCSSCGNKWTEQDIISRTKTGYSYNPPEPTPVVEGIRATSASASICFQCARAPISQFGWVDQPTDCRWFDPQTEEMKEAWNEKQTSRAKGSTKAPTPAEQQATIAALLKL